MNSGQSIRALHGQFIHRVIVTRLGRGVAPGQEDELAVAVERVVKDPLPLLGEDEVPHVDVLRLGEGLWTVVGVGALVVRGAALVPVEAPVTVGIHALQVMNLLQ